MIGAVSIALASGCSDTAPVSSNPLTNPKVTATPTAAPTATPTIAPTSTPVAQQATTWKINAGGQEESDAIQGLRYYPHAITIDAGDSIQWSYPGDEPHTVTFPVAGTTPAPPNDPDDSAPAGGTTANGTYISSGFLLAGGVYTVNFPTAGTYTYYCLIHPPEMVGSVVVQPAGTAYPSTQAQYSTAAASDLSTDLNAGAASLTSFPYTVGGAHIAAGVAPGLAAGAPATSSVLRFLDSDSISAAAVTVPVGTTVTWTNQSNNEPHDVVFAAIGGTVPSTLGPFDPASGGSTYDGSTLTDSGVIPPGASYSLTFTVKGTFTYICLFHNNELMQGSLTVQ